MKVLFLASEGLPFSKSGGLADVVGSLPKQLCKKGVDVRVMLPLYGSMATEMVNQLEKKAEFTVQMGWRNQYCGVLEVEHDGVHYYLLDNEYFFNRDYYYAYDDDAERFAFFSRAALASLPFIEFMPDLIHVHDWQTATVPLLLKAHYTDDQRYQGIRTVLTIHNLKYQGIFPKHVLPDLLQVGWQFFHPDGVEFFDQVNFLKAGIMHADVVTTVSPTYAQEIRTEYYGEQLHGALNRRGDDLHGIVNGLDIEAYDPMTDPHIFKNYGEETIQKKGDNKTKLQESLGFEVTRRIPMIAMVSRLVSQKGLDLVGRVLEDILDTGVQLVVLGTGDKRYEDVFRRQAHERPQQVSANICFDNGLAHKIYAAADMFLMPSLFEPCGLSQLIALRYGTVPIVRETGGLKDTVTAYEEETKQGNGFTFTNYNAHDMLFTIERALKFYRNKRIWGPLRRRAMKYDSSWTRSAKEYILLYQGTCS